MRPTANIFVGIFVAVSMFFYFVPCFATEYPDYDADMARLKKISSTYFDAAKILNDPELTKKAVQSFPNDNAFFRSMPKKYSSLLKTGNAKEFEVQMDASYSKLNKFQKVKNAYTKVLPEDIEKILAIAMEQAQSAKDNKKVLHFKGGIKQSMDEANHLLKVMAAINGDNAENVVSFKQKLAAQQTMFNEMAASISFEDEAVPFPKDIYSGRDKDDIKRQVIAALAYPPVSLSQEDIYDVSLTSEWKEGIYTDSKNTYRKIQATIMLADDDNDGISGFISYSFIADKTGGKWQPMKFKAFCNGCPEGYTKAKKRKI